MSDFQVDFGNLTQSALSSIYDDLYIKFNAALNADERSFHLNKFSSYSLSSSSITKFSDFDYMFEDAMPVMTEAKAAEVAKSARFVVDNTAMDLITLRDARARMGALGDHIPLSNLTAPDDLPVNYSAIDAHPECPTLAFARDQGSCGSCWAFATAGAFADRLCIASKGSFTLPLSTGFTNSCSGAGSCKGGSTIQAWEYFASNGIPTGGEKVDLGSGYSCYPYQLSKCGHRLEIPGLLPGCYRTDVRPASELTPICAGMCTDDKYPLTLEQDLRFATNPRHFYTRADVMRTLFREGPISTNFPVYEDFYTYKSGVYEATESRGKMVGWHAVRLTGWGVDEATGLEYWEAMNSWNEFFGENNGRFRVSIESGLFGTFCGASAVWKEADAMETQVRM